VLGLSPWLDEVVDFYVYIHRRGDTDEPFYVGKGKGRRAVQCEGRNRYWKRVVAKHGFTVEIVAWFAKESEAFDCEVVLISELRSAGYDLTNMTDGGEGGSHCAETKARLSRLSKGRVYPPRREEWCEKLSVAHRGRRFSQAHRERLREVAFTRKHTPTTKAKLSETMKRLAKSPGFRESRSLCQIGGRNHNAKPVFCVTTGQSFNSAADAARQYVGIGRTQASLVSSIRQCCSGRLKTSIGMQWRYVTEG
jgi:hypothetical protein